MPHLWIYFKINETSTEEKMREWMARQMEANERMKDQVVELERQINQGLRNRHVIIKNLERQFKYLEKTQYTKSLPRTTNTKPRQEFVYKPPSIRNENDKGDVEFIEEDETQPIPTTFADDVLLNHVGGKELKSIDGVGTERMTKKEIKKDNMGLPKEPNKEWKLNKKVVPHNNGVYHYLWHPTEIPHLNRIIKES
ncbi:hypothetical protein Tco_0931884 [Tanacetum coccineum]